MQDPAGFLRQTRVEADKQSANLRVRHWYEYEQVMSPDRAGRQAGRCMDCATPGCHIRCPVHNLIPDWNLLVSEADWYAAWRQLEDTNARLERASCGSLVFSARRLTPSPRNRQPIG